MRYALLAVLLLVGSVQAGSRNDYGYGSGANSEYEQVDGYQRSDGTYVDSYYRTKANDTTDDNYSTSGNYNPWTGRTGTRKSESIWDE